MTADEGPVEETDYGPVGPDRGLGCDTEVAQCPMASRTVTRIRCSDQGRRRPAAGLSQVVPG